MTETNSKLDEAFDMIQTDPEKSLANFDEILLKDSKNVEAINGGISLYEVESAKQSRRVI